MTDRHTYHALSIEESFAAVHSASTGLTSTEVKTRLQEYGPNTLPEPKRATWFFLLWKQCSSFLIVILLVAVVVSYALGDHQDAWIIFAAVLLNVIVGFAQEYRAGQALAALRRVISLQAKVRRDDKEELIDAKLVVPGDVILLAAGDTIPADARLCTVSECEVNESALTGESTHVVKQLESVHASATVGDRSNMVFTGTTVMKGSAEAVVVATGVATEVGHIADLIHRTRDEDTPLQKKLDVFARQVGITVLVVCAVILAAGLAFGMPFVSIFTTAVAIAVSAIPEGLVVAVTIILAIGMQRILKRNALVRNLQAAETLGSTSVICTDKTGTITEGNMKVVSLVTHDYHFRDLHQVERHDVKGLEELVFALNIGMLCNDAHVMPGESPMEELVIVGNFTERALLAAAVQIGLDQKKLNHDEPRIRSIPFNSTTKFMATLHQHPKAGRRIYVKGAPENVVAMCTQIRTGASAQRFTAKQRQEFEKKAMEYSAQGLRILALAYKDVPKQQETLRVEDCDEMTFVGFVAIQDPLRKGMQEIFARTRSAGITTVMITGDHKLTAQAIAKQLGLPTAEENILEGERLHQMTQEELNAIVEHVSVYARVSPEDKLNIIRAWQSKGKVVAMTGDGVNDSPALKAANIGIALGAGTDVAKEVSDMVLLDNRFESIVAAVEEGRGIFDNIRKVVLYLVSDSFSEVVLISLCLFLTLPMPLAAAQILWINLVADGLPNIALTLEPKEKGIMKEPPRSPKEPVVNREMRILIMTISVFTACVNLIVFLYYLRVQSNLPLAQTIVFTNLAIDSLLYVFSVRSLRRTLFDRNVFQNPWLIVAVKTALVVQLAAVYLPPLQRVLGTVALGWSEWGVVVSVSITVIAVFEFTKFLFRFFSKKPQFT